MNTSWYGRQRLGLPKATPGSQLVWRGFTENFLQSKMLCSTLTKEQPPGLVQVSSQTRPPKTLLCLPQSPGQRWSMKITLKGQITLAHQVPSHNWVYVGSLSLGHPSVFLIFSIAMCLIAIVSNAFSTPFCHSHVHYSEKVEGLWRASNATTKHKVVASRQMRNWEDAGEGTEATPAPFSSCFLNPR